MGITRLNGIINKFNTEKIGWALVELGCGYKYMDSILDYGQRHFYLYAMFIPKKTVQFNGFWFKEVSTMSAEVVERGLVSQFEAAFGNKPICNVS